MRNWDIGICFFLGLLKTGFHSPSVCLGEFIVHVVFQALLPVCIKELVDFEFEVNV